jgi:hypothetical protein
MGNTKNKITANGDVVYWEVEVCNTGTETCKDAFLEFTNPIPEGIELVYQGLPNLSPAYSTGIYNAEENRWYIGDIESNTCQEILFKFKITDVTQSSWNIQVISRSSCTENIVDNLIAIDIEAVEDCEVGNLKIGPSIGVKSTGGNLKIGG